jgi:hypothetical protein
MGNFSADISISPHIYMNWGVGIACFMPFAFSDWIGESDALDRLLTYFNNSENTGKFKKIAFEEKNLDRFTGVLGKLLHPSLNRFIIYWTNVPQKVHGTPAPGQHMIHALSYGSPYPFIQN